MTGLPGIGKSHCAVAIAVGAIRAGYRVLVRSTFDLVQDFAEAEAAGQRRAFVQTLTRVDLLVVEDFGMKKLGPSAAEDLLEVFVRRHETASTLITTNRPTQDWGVFLGDVPATTAILDRFLAHAEIVTLQGKSYRLGNAARRAAASLPPCDVLSFRRRPMILNRLPGWPGFKRSSVAAFQRSVTPTEAPSDMSLATSNTCVF